MNWDTYYKIMLALTAWREARGEKATLRESLRAVMHVIRNRVHAGFGDWDHVITAKWQFSSLTAPGDSQLIVWPDSPNTTFELCLQLADAVFDGTDPDVTGGALYYANLATMTSKWFQENIVEKRKHTATIGHHTFYA